MSDKIPEEGNNLPPVESAPNPGLPQGVTNHTDTRTHDHTYNCRGTRGRGRRQIKVYSPQPVMSGDQENLHISEKVNPNMEADGFKLVQRKTRRRSCLTPRTSARQIPSHTITGDTIDDSPTSEDEDTRKALVQSCVKALTKCINQMDSSRMQAHTVTALEAMIGELDITKEDVKKLVCFGLGTFSKHWESRYQFALLYNLKLFLGDAIIVELYDPCFTKLEKWVLEKEFGFEVLQKNEAGNRKVDEYTLFYCPHAPHKLQHNVVRANWDGTLRNCIIIGNSFSDVSCGFSKMDVYEELPYIMKVLDSVEEIRIDIDCFKSDAFNNTSIHFFPNGVVGPVTT